VLFSSGNIGKLSTSAAYRNYIYYCRYRRVWYQWRWRSSYNCCNRRSLFRRTRFVRQRVH